MLYNASYNQQECLEVGVILGVASLIIIIGSGSSYLSSINSSGSSNYMSCSYITHPEAA